MSTSWPRLLPQLQFYHVPFTVEYKIANDTWAAAGVTNVLQLKNVYKIKLHTSFIVVSSSVLITPH